MPNPDILPLSEFAPAPKHEDRGEGFNYDLIKGAGHLTEMVEGMPSGVAMAGFDADRFSTMWERMGQGMAIWDPAGLIRADEDKPGWVMGDPYGATVGSRPGPEKSESLRKTAAELMKAEAVERSGGPAATDYVNMVAKAEADYAAVVKELDRLGLEVTQHWSDTVKETAHTLNEQFGVDWRWRHTPQNQAKIWGAGLLTICVNNAALKTTQDPDKTYTPLVMEQMRGFYKAMPADFTPEQFYQDMNDVDGLRRFGSLDNPALLYSGTYNFDAVEHPQGNRDEVLRRHYRWTFGKDMPTDTTLEQKKSFAKSIVDTYDRLRDRSHNAARWGALGVNIPPDKVGDGKLTVSELPFFRDAVQMDARLRLAQVGEGDRHAYAEHQVRNDFISRLAKDPADVVYQTIYNLPHDERRLKWAEYATNQLKAIRDPNKRYVEWSRLATKATHIKGGGPLGRDEYYHDPVVAKRWNELFDRAVYQHAEYQKNASEQLIRSYDPAQNKSLQDRATQRRLYMERQGKLLQEAANAPMPATFFWVMGAVDKVVEATGVRKMQDALWTPVTEEFMQMHHNGDFIRGGAEGLGRPETLGEMVTEGVRSVIPLGFGDWFDSENMMRRYAEKVRAGTAIPVLDQSVLTLGLLLDSFTKLPGLMAEAPIEFAMFDKVMRGHGRARHGIVKGLLKAGVNERLVGAVEFALNPIDFMQPMKRMFFWSPEVARVIGNRLPAMRRLFNKDTPEVRRDHHKLVTRLVEEQGRSVYKLPETKLNEIVALSADMQADAAAYGHLRRGTAKRWGDAMKDLPLSLARDLNIPYAKSQPLVGNALHRARGFEQKQKALLRAEATSQGSGQFDMQGSSEAALIEMLNARAAGKANFIDSVLDNRLGRLLSTEQRQGLKDYFAKRIEIKDAAPHLAEELPSAMKALAETKRQAECRINELRSSVNHRKVELADLDLQIRAEQSRAPLVGAAESRAKLAKLMGEKARTVRHKLTMEQEAARIGAATEVTAVGDKYTQGRGRFEGIEVGHRSNLPDDVKRQMIRDRVLSCEGSGGRAWADYNQGEAIASIWRRVYEPTRNQQRSIHRRGLELDGIRNLIAEGKLKEAAKVLGYKKVGRVLSEPEVMKVWNNRAEKLQQEYNGLREQRLRAVETEALQIPDLFDVSSIDTNYQKALTALRKWGMLVEGLAGTAKEQGGGPALSYHQLLKLQSQSWGHSRAIGLSELYVDATSDFNNIVINKLQSMYRELGDRDRALCDDVLTGRRRVTDPKVTAEIRTIVFEEGALRNVLLDKLLRLGKISPEQHRLYVNEGWETRVYMDNFMASELRKAGHQVGTGNGKLAPTNTPQFQELKARQSTRYVRQFYEQGRKLREERFYCDDHGGPKGALKAAEAWAQQRLKDKILLKSEIKKPVKAITDADLGGMGLITDQGMVRFDRLRSLFAQAAKLEFFNHVAGMYGMARNDITGVPASRRGGWTEAPLSGKQWGALEGKFVHKNLFKLMNSWTGWSQVLDGAAAAMHKSVSEVWTPGSMLESALYGEGKPRVWDRFLNWADHQLRHRLIANNPGSWVNNHLGAAYQSWQAGGSPASLTQRSFHNELPGLLDKLASGKLKKGSPLYQDLMDFAGQGGFSMSQGLPGKMQINITGKHGWRNILPEVANRLVGEQKHLLNKAKAAQKAIKRAELGLASGEFTGKQAIEVRERVGRWRDALEQLKQEIMVADHVPPHMAKSKRTPGGLDMQRLFLDANKSKTAQVIADLYGQVDAQYKWGTYRQLTEVKGWSKEHALAQIGSYFQNYPAVPPYIRQLKKMRVFGAFVPSFSYEAGRIWGNMMWHNPAKALAILGAPFVWNMANLAASGLLPSDYLEANHAKSTFEQIKELGFTLNMNVAGTAYRLNVLQPTGLGPFMESAGVGRYLIDKQLVPTVDDKFGAGAAIPAAMALNYFSNFALNTPWASMATKVTTGVDPFNQEMVYHQEGEMDWSSVAGDLSALFVPRAATRYLFEEKEKADLEMTSLITKHNRTQLESALKIFGVNVSHYTPRELMARLMVKFQTVEQRAELLKESWTDEDQRLREYDIQINKELDPDRRNEIIKEAAQYLQKTKADTTYIGGRRIDTGLSWNDAVKRIINRASRNVLQTIERTPIEHMPEAAYTAELSGYSEFAPDMVMHAWTQLIDERYLSGRSDVGKLAEAWQKCCKFRNQAGGDAIRAKFDLAKMALMRRIRQVLLRQRTPILKRLLRTKLGGWQGAVREEFARGAGLLQ